MGHGPNYLPGPTTGWTPAGGWPAEASRDKPDVTQDSIVADGAGIPSPDEVFNMFERGEFDGPNPLVAEEVVVDEAELPVVAEDDVITWRQHVVRSVRAAGRRATWRERRGIKERSGDHERPPFVGRYAGKAVVTDQMIESEWGGLELDLQG